VLSFSCSIDDLSVSQGKLVDIMKSWLFSENKIVFSLLKFDDDVAFTEPSLFHLFFYTSGKNTSSTIAQHLVGYMADRQSFLDLVCKYDRYGILNLPNLGYHKSPKETEIFRNIVDKLSSIENIPNSQIRCCIYGTEYLEQRPSIVLLEAPEETIKRNIVSLMSSFDFIRENAADLWDLIKLVTREIVLFNSPNQNSFAAIAHHGTAYINTEDKIQTVPFFVDEIAHQCGHIIFNVLTLDSARFLRVPKEAPLRKFVRNFGESRTVYGAFHGLFTYTTILYALSRFVDNSEKYTEMDHYEAFGRIGFYIDKFREDLKLMERASVLTDEGMFYHEQFRSGFLAVSETFGARIANFKYYNQPYTFQLDRFLKANPMHGRSRLFGLF
jgi:hypothetical protein